MINITNKVIGTIRKVNDTFTLIAFSAIAFIVLLQVIFRYLFGSPLRWTEELGRYAQVWMIMLGGAYAMRSGSHLAIDILTASLPPKVKRITDIIVYLVMIAFFAIVTLYGIQLTLTTVKQLSPAMSISMSYVYAALPVGGVLMGMETLLRFIKILKKEEK